MGFFRRLFRAKKKPATQTPASKPPKRRWSFAKHTPQPPSSTLNHHYDPSSPLDANKHAIAVAAATAAVAEAALAAAHAAAEVVRLTSTGAPPTTPTTTSRPNVSSAAVKIQSAFRGYLARRALRALKALVKLQALVRGHIVRKQTADMLRRMQTLVRLQAQARATRVFSHTNHTMHSFKPSLSHCYPVPEEYSTKFDGSSILKRCSSNANFRNSEWERGARFGSTWLERWMKERENRERRINNEDEEKMSDKILEVDTWKPPLRSLKGKEEVCSRTADNSPQALLSSSSSRRHGGPFTPTRSECSFHGYAGHPNYMSNTHSSRAKVRSQSAPRQRLDYDRFGYSYSNNTVLQGVWDNNHHYHYHSHLRSKVSSSRFNRIGVTNLR